MSKPLRQDQFENLMLATWQCHSLCSSNHVIICKSLIKKCTLGFNWQASDFSTQSLKRILHQNEFLKRNPKNGPDLTWFCTWWNIEILKGQKKTSPLIEVWFALQDSTLGADRLELETFWNYSNRNSWNVSNTSTYPSSVEIKGMHNI